MIKVLFISQWYPHRYDKMFGLFVQKHAQAVSVYCEVKVLYVFADKNINRFEIEESHQPNFSELIVYYPKLEKKLFNFVFNAINYLTAYYKGLKLLRKEGFQPDIVHANILTRTAFIAYLLKLRKGIPYVVTEHWSRYLAIKNSYKGFLRKILTQMVVKNASAILPVSETLKNAMLSHKLVNNNYIIVNNVVDNYFFKETIVVHRTKKRILNISCFDEHAKNTKGIIRATNELAKRRDDFELILIGTGMDYNDVFEFSQMLDFPKGVVHFLGEKTPEEVANWVKNSDFLVLFSNYETAGVVIAESLVCGKLVLSTKVGAAPEYINEQNGIIIDVGDETALVEKMNYLLDHIDDYDNTIIKNEARKKFDSAYIGGIITEIYTQSLKAHV